MSDADQATAEQSFGDKLFHHYNQLIYLEHELWEFFERELRIPCDYATYDHYDRSFEIFNCKSDTLPEGALDRVWALGFQRFWLHWRSDDGSQWETYFYEGGTEGDRDRLGDSVPEDGDEEDFSSHVHRRQVARFKAALDDAVVALREASTFASIMNSTLKSIGHAKTDYGLLALHTVGVIDAALAKASGLEATA